MSALCALVALLPVHSAPVSQMQTMMTWFAGDFDNYDQLEDFTVNNVTEEHDKLHSIFFNAKLPEFSDDVLYVQQSSEGDPTKIYRQRLYVFKTKSSKSISMDIWQFTNPEKYVDAQSHPTILSKLNPSSNDVSLVKGCSVEWQYDATRQQFNGSTSDTGTCTATVKDYPLPGNHTYLITDTNLLNKNQVWIHEKWFLWDHGKKGKQALGKVYADKLTRSKPIRKFVGWLAIENAKEATGYVLEFVLPSQFTGRFGICLHLFFHVIAFL